jgi:hypothetical protein
MAPHHPNLQDVCAFLSGHGPQKPAEKSRQLGAYQGFSAAGGPHQVNVHAVPHGGIFKQ